VPKGSPIRPEVAVVVPCFNVERCLQRALDSTFAQTYTDFHVYAVDDGSTDSTIKVLETNARHCSFVSQPHSGPSAARNRAIQMSSSPYLAFLDADDEWLPNKLECQMALLKEDPTVGLVSSLCLFSNAENESHSIFAKEIPRSGRLFRQLVRKCFVFTPTVIVRRRCLEDVGFFNESLAVSEDFNLWLRIAARWKIAFLPQLLVISHKRRGSLSATIPAEERLRNGVAALEHVQSSCPDLPPTEARALRSALAERLYFHGSFLLSVGANEPARRKLASALKLQPTHWRALAKLGLGLLPARASDLLLGLRTKFTRRSRYTDASQLEPWDASSI